MTMTPNFLYGTAWKEDLTAECVFNALKVGYRAVDTANQRKHYYEEGVGNGLAKAFSELDIKREDIFLQTKFTFARGQDHRKPYDENASFHDQVQQSFEKSLEHLQTDYIDSLVLHGPYMNEGICDEDLETWKSMEEVFHSGRVKMLGVSNCSLDQLEALYAKASVKPKFLQNRCYAERYWDRDIRKFCDANDVTYQGFSLLTANRKFLSGVSHQPEHRTTPKTEFSNEGLHPEIEKIVQETGQNIQQVIFRFAQHLGMFPLMGSREVSNMEDNLKTENFELNDSEIETIEKIAFL